jgi:hypothetical protein
MFFGVLQNTNVLYRQIKRCHKKPPRQSLAPRLERQNSFDRACGGCQIGIPAEHPPERSAGLMRCMAREEFGDQSHKTRKASQAGNAGLVKPIKWAQAPAPTSKPLCTLSRLVHNQDRHATVRQDFRCLAAQEQLPEAATPMGGHDD